MLFQHVCKQLLSIVLAIQTGAYSLLHDTDQNLPWNVSRPTTPRKSQILLAPCRSRHIRDAKCHLKQVVFYTPTKASSLSAGVPSLLFPYCSTLHSFQTMDQKDSQSTMPSEVKSVKNASLIATIDSDEHNPSQASMAEDSSAFSDKR